MFGLISKSKSPVPAAPTASAPELDETRPSGYKGIIPDGVRWTSANGVPCFKVPVQMMETVCFLFPEISLEELTPSQKATLLSIVAEANTAATSKDFLVFPVRAEKQTAMNLKFRTNLTAMNRALRTVTNQTRIQQVLGE